MILGIDIAKATLAVTLLSEGEGRPIVGQRQVANTASGHEQLCQWLASRVQEPLHVCMEATNIYWEEVAARLHGAGYTVSVVNPMRIKGYAMSQLRRNKTDKLDSEVIAAFCASQQPDAWQPLAAHEQQLRSWQRHRQSLVRTRTQQQQRLGESRDEEVRRSLQKVIDLLNEEIAAIEQQIAELTEQQVRLREQKALLLSIPGIGEQTAHGLLAEMPDLAQYASAAAAAADAGLTPAHYESGTSVHKRPHLCKVGKTALRSYLYLPALNAMRTNPVLRAFAERLEQRHKPKMVIIGAVMRKLLHLAYGVLKHGKPFDPDYLLTRSPDRVPLLV